MVEKTAEEQLAEATAIREYHICNVESAFTVMPAIASEVVEYNDKLGCFVRTDYTADNEIVAAELIFVEQ